MYRSFRHFIEKNSLLEHKQRVLLAVSGGADSMAMLHLFSLCEWDFAVAHCNFGLRSSESDGDQQLVEKMAKEYGKPLFVKRFDTKKYAQENGLSIQVAARNLRYNWFEELSSTLSFDAIAIAHNANDVAETMLINLTRGTGLKGLSGIKARNGKVIRPLLFATRTQIDNYVKEKGLQFRTDSSNLENKYIRNRIRNEVLPILIGINPSLIDSLNQTAGYLQQAQKAIGEDISKFKEVVYSQVGSEHRYSIDYLISYQYNKLFIAEEFSTYGFSVAITDEIYSSLYAQPGKEFLSKTHRMVRDRDFLIVSPMEKQNLNFEVEIFETTSIVFEPIPLKISLIEVGENFKIDRNSNTASIDFAELKFPIKLRVWQNGDRFIPYGMKGSKKVSDFLIDEKVPLHQKDSVYVVESNGEIVWVVGYRVDNRYAVTAKTKLVYKVALNK
jgi:tRNA(Ile)-lysidine synthase